MRKYYWISKRIANAFSAFFSELLKPISFLKGEEFEKCLREKVFISEQFELVMKTHDYHENKKDYVGASLLPDYLFKDKTSGKEFFVEAKYRDSLYKDKLDWCSPSQFKRYKKVNIQYETYIAVGLGGRPRNPESIYIIPLKDIEFNALYPSFLNDYKYEGKRKGLFDKVFDKVYTS